MKKSNKKKKKKNPKMNNKRWITARYYQDFKDLDKRDDKDC